MLRALLFLLSLVVLAPARAAEKPDQARIRLPWDILKSVLKLDQDQVRLSSEEFQLLSRMTGQRPASRAGAPGGDVLMTRAEFHRLIQSLLPPAEDSGDFYVTRAVHRGRLARRSAVFTAEMWVEVPRRPAKPLRVDLFPAVAFQEVRLDGKPALTEVENGRLLVTMAEPGSHRVEVRFAVPVPEAEGAQTLSMPLPQTPITEWVLDLPEANLDVSVNPALHREVGPAPGGGTRVRALLPPSGAVSAAWNPLAPDSAKGPAQVYAEAAHLLSVHDDALTVQSRVDLEILQNTISGVRLAVPEGFSVLAVQGEASKDWQEIPGRPAVLDIPFRSARKGRVHLEVSLERLLPEVKSTATFTGLPVQGALRERGQVAIELQSDAELPPPSLDGNLERIDARELPADFTGRSQRPILFAYRFPRPPFGLSLVLARHETLSVVSTVIDLAEASTVIRPDGKRVHRVTYQLRNPSSQFLQLSLPAKARLWSAFVDNRPVKPVRGADNRVLVPLVRSGAGDAVPVEIIYFEQSPRLGFFGRRDLGLPMPDVRVSRLEWSVVTPPEHRFVFRAKDFERPAAMPPSNALARGIPGQLAARMAPQRSFGAKRKSGGTFRRDGPVRGEMDVLESQVAGVDLGRADPAMEELEDRREGTEEKSAAPAPTALAPQEADGDFLMAGGVGASEVAGVLPVRVNIPMPGAAPEVFLKTLPEPSSLQALSLYHTAGWVPWAVRWVLVLMLGLLAWLRRAWIGHGVGRGTAWLRPRLPRVGPFGWAFFLLAAMLTGLFRGPWFLLSFLLYSVAAGRWILSLLDRPQGDKR